MPWEKKTNFVVKVKTVCESVDVNKGSESELCFHCVTQGATYFQQYAKYNIFYLDYLQHKEGKTTHTLKIR